MRIGSSFRPAALPGESTEGSIALSCDNDVSKYCSLTKKASMKLPSYITGYPVASMQARYAAELEASRAAHAESFAQDKVAMQKECHQRVDNAQKDLASAQVNCSFAGHPATFGT